MFERACARTCKHVEHYVNERYEMSQDGRAVANFILDECEITGIPVSQLALQKLVFFCHAWHLVEYDKPLVRQNFEAWEYGPVLPYLYSEFKASGDRPIQQRAKKLNRFNGKKETAYLDLPDDEKRFLKKVVQFYSRLTASQLVELSHCEDGPWARVWEHSGKINPGMKIDNANIYQYYSRVPRAAKVQ